MRIFSKLFIVEVTRGFIKMADAGVFAKDADILLRVGANASATVKAAGWFDSIIIDQEAIINCMTRFDWSALDDGTTMNASVRGILVDTGACLAAIEGIQFDLTGFSSRNAENKINTLRDIALRNMGILRSIPVQTFVLGVAP